MRHSKLSPTGERPRLGGVISYVGRSSQAARCAAPPDSKSRSRNLSATHPDFTRLKALHLAGGTKIERDIALRRNNGSHWEKIAQDTGYTVLGVKRIHRAAQHKAISGSVPHLTRKQTGYVYFLRSDGHIKIGYAVDVAARVKELQCGNPTTLKLIGTIPGKPSAERDLHRRFNSDRVHGEWFRQSPKLLAFIEAEVTPA